MRKVMLIAVALSAMTFGIGCENDQWTEEANKYGGTTYTEPMNDVRIAFIQDENSQILCSYTIPWKLPDEEVAKLDCEDKDTFYTPDEGDID